MERVGDAQIWALWWLGRGILAFCLGIIKKGETGASLHMEQGQMWRIQNNFKEGYVLF